MSAGSTLESEQGMNRGNYVSRSVFEGQNYRMLVRHYNTDRGVVTWEVGIPVLSDNRPVVDDSLIKAGRTRSLRINLAIHTEPDKITVQLNKLHTSGSDVRPIPLKPPVASDAENTVFSMSQSFPDFDTLSLTLDRDGQLEYRGVQPGGAEQTIYSGNSLADADYDGVINFMNRMMVIPFFDGTFRKPINPTT